MWTGWHFVTVTITRRDDCARAALFLHGNGNSWHIPHVSSEKLSLRYPRVEYSTCFPSRCTRCHAQGSRQLRYRGETAPGGCWHRMCSPGGDSPRDRHGHRASPWSRQGERHPACWGTQFWCVLSTVVLCSEAAGAGRAALTCGACRSPWFATAGAYQMGRDSQLGRGAEQAGPDPATALTHNLTGSVHFKLQNLSFSYVSFMNARQCFRHISSVRFLSFIRFPSEQINPLALLPFLACQRVTRSSASEGPCEEQGGQSCELPCPAKSPLKDRMAVQSIIKSLKMKMKQAHIFC